MNKKNTQGHVLLIRYLAHLGKTKIKCYYECQQYWKCRNWLVKRTYLSRKIDRVKKFSQKKNKRRVFLRTTKRSNFLFWKEKQILHTSHQALDQPLRKKWTNWPYSTRLRRWLDRLAHFKTSVQQSAGNKLKISKNLKLDAVEKAFTVEKY